MKTRIIAEIGTAHRGSLKKAEHLIRQAAESGADTVKFQIVFAREILHPFTGNVPLPGGDTPLYEVFQSLEQDLSFYQELQAMCRAENVEFLATPFGMESAALLKKLSPTAVKIASPELNYTELLEELSTWSIPVFLSSGVSLMEDIREAVQVLGSEDLTLFHCVTAYPAPAEDYNLSVLPLLRKELGVKMGVSDHSLDASLVPCIARYYGAEAIEKHFTLSREEDGLDDPIALEVDGFKLMADRLHELDSLGSDREKLDQKLLDWFSAEDIQKVKGHGEKKLSEAEKNNYGRTNRSIHVLYDLKKGTILSQENCAVLRTEKELSVGMHPRYHKTIIGQKILRDMTAGEGILEKDLAL